MYNVLLSTNSFIQAVALKETIKEVLMEDLAFETVGSFMEMRMILHKRQTQLLVLDFGIIDPIDRWALQKMTKQSQQLKILVLCEGINRETCRGLYKNGVLAVLERRATLNELKSAIDCTYKGEIYFNNRMLTNFILSANIQAPVQALSAKEKAMVKLLLGGKGTKEISELMQLRTSTVSNSKKRLYEKLNVTNLIELNNLMQVAG